MKKYTFQIIGARVPATLTVEAQDEKQAHIEVGTILGDDFFTFGELKLIEEHQ